MTDAVTDTHGLIWYLEDSLRLSPAAREVFAACDQGSAVVFVPTICLVEIVYLEEKGRIPSSLRAELEAHLREGTSGLFLAPLTREVAETLPRVPRVDVPDMPDRIIAATAVQLGLPLISRDRRIELSDVATIW
jgi:PIN domain nuclease of toxin-antitoxin system